METPKYSNRLVNETSPYLLQHAHNPVEWFPWGPTALDKARKENKPIFLSIGYSACHWCHVMAHESFEDEKTAELMNRWFVNIKVDREERPDVDAVYMKALVELTGHGGWPLSIFLTPDQKPFFGGTYYPPSRKYNRPGFSDILTEVHERFSGQSSNVTSRAEQILSKLNSSQSAHKGGNFPDLDLIDKAVEMLESRFDADLGGFGNGMKFPEPMIYTLLLRHWQRTGSQTALEMLDKSLTHMAEGGINDQLGGGFHRYSTDKEWKIPHFEKMLYDNALLAKLFIETFQATKQEIYKNTAIETLDYVLNELTSSDGAFYSSQDADTSSGEGEYYVWELKEVLNLLGPRHAKVFARVYGVTPSGNIGKKNVLRVVKSMEKVSAEEGIAIFEVQHIVTKGKETLLEARNKRQKPATDEKIITAWNGLMITALSRGASVLGEAKYLLAARSGAKFIWDHMWGGEGLLRIHKDGISKINGCLDDYACFLQALLSLYEASFEFEWIEKARQVADKMIEEFWDGENGGFYMTGESQEPLITRLKNPADEAIPSANAIAVLSLVTLGHLTGKEEYREKAGEALKAFQPLMEKSPAAFTGCLSALDSWSSSPTEVIFTGSKDETRFKEMQAAVQEDYRPNKILLWSENETTQNELPLTQGKSAIKGEPTVYLCQQQTCQPPVHSGKALTNILERPQEIRLNIFDLDKRVAEIQTKEQDKFLDAMGEIFKHSGLGGKK
ncbi:MAG: thioredoxin domain-containing protein [Nitrospinae bacterium]|nr:thioredoxin domain-containing protein [Nitrospinota bacterium]